MTVRLKYTGEKKLSFKVTTCPISNPKASPMPTGMSIDELDEKDPEFKKKRDAILGNADYAESEDITLKKGINEFENNEQAEYLYRMLGNPEIGGTIPFGVNQEHTVVNGNCLIEVDEKGIEIRGTKSLFDKYRKPSGIQMHEVPSATAYDDTEKK